MAGTNVPKMPEFLACSCAVRLFPEINAAIVADADHGAMVPIAGVLFELDPLLARRARHERCHLEQAARYAPAWVPIWFPLAMHAWLGRRGWWEEYSKEHAALGYLGNPFEIEARRAENLLPRVDADGDLLTPVDAG